MLLISEVDTLQHSGDAAYILHGRSVDTSQHFTVLRRQVSAFGGVAACVYSADRVDMSRHLVSLRKILNGVDTLPTNGGAHRALHCGRTARRGEGMQAVGKLLRG